MSSAEDTTNAITSTTDRTSLLNWKRLSIRTQLMILIVGLLIVIQLSTLALINWFDAKERQTIATEQAQTLARSLNNDFLKTILNPNIENFTELSFRIAGYTPVDAVIIRNETGQAIYEHGQDAYLKLARQLPASTPTPYFDGEHLFIVMPVEAEQHVFGSALIIIDPKQYATQIEHRFSTLLWIFPMEILLGMLVAGYMSRGFTQPFSQLAKAMSQQAVLSQTYQPITTSAENEVGLLFDGYNAMMLDIQQRTQELRFQSTHDSLTGLYNRYAIEQIITQTLQTATSEQHHLLHLDLDRFKLVNDAFGHSAGDELLQLLAQSMQHLLPSTASLARLGADDFMVLLPDTTNALAEHITQSLLTLLHDYRFVWQGQAISVSGSIGMVSFSANEYTLTELIKAADIAFYIAKSSGRNHCHRYHNDDQHAQQIDRDIQVAGYIKEALSDGPSRFELFAQAIVPLQMDSDEIGYEILLRLWDSEGRFIPPDNFLPTAERYQLMTEIDRYVLTTYLNTVCQQPAHVQRLHIAHVNLSGSSLNNPDFQASIKDAIVNIQFPWRKLALEVTETSAVGNLTQAIDFIRYCQNIGIGFALDDFGTGMSSFEYLKHLPFDVVKIDGSFIKDMHQDPTDMAVIRYIHEISALRQQETVAEYVETEQDVQALRSIGITYGQGYYLGKPKPLREWLE